MDVVVGQGPSVADEVPVGLPWSFPAWGSDLVAFHRQLAFLVLVGRLYLAVQREDPAVVPVVALAGAVVVVVAFPVAVMGLPVDHPDMD